MDRRNTYAADENRKHRLGNSKDLEQHYKDLRARYEHLVQRYKHPDRYHKHLVEY